MLKLFEKLFLNLKNILMSVNKIDQPQILFRKKKVALLMAYSGVNYFGMQKNNLLPTIERELIDALVKSDSIQSDHALDLFKTKFQRAARTDKNVSALGQVCSLKMKVMSNSVEEINKHLPPFIKTIDVIKTTQGFNSKLSCSSRTYIYIMPTYGFVPPNELSSLSQFEYRISSLTLNSAREYLAIYRGSHNFFNFTSGKIHSDKSAQRYIMNTEVSEPFLRNGIEFVVITIKGQSFMLHQIRKMISLIMAVIRNIVSLDAVYNIWLPVKKCIPKAPGLGLILKEVHYDYYNSKWADDPTKNVISFEKHREKIDEFAEKYVYPNIINTEIEEKTIFLWSTTEMPSKYQMFDNPFTKSRETAQDLDAEVKVDEGLLTNANEITDSDNTNLLPVDLNSDLQEKLGVTRETLIEDGGNEEFIKNTATCVDEGLENNKKRIKLLNSS